MSSDTIILLLHTNQFNSKGKKKHSYSRIPTHAYLLTHSYSRIPTHAYLLTHSYSPIPTHPFLLTHTTIFRVYIQQCFNFACLKIWNLQYLSWHPYLPRLLPYLQKVSQFWPKHTTHGLHSQDDIGIFSIEIIFFQQHHISLSNISSAMLN